MAANKQSNKLYVALGVGMVVLVILIKLFGGASNAPSAGSGAIPPLTGDDWIEGSRTAGVVVTEYSDFQCPACGGYYPIVKQLYDKFSKQIAIVYRHFPLCRLR
jgi:protein-disulfide isomerase